MLLLTQPRIWLPFWAASTHCQVMLNLLSTSTPKPLSSEVLSIPSSRSLYCYRGLPQPRCRTLHVALLSLMRLTQAHSSSLSRSLWIASLPSIAINCTIQLGVTCKLSEVSFKHSTPLSMSLIKTFNNAGLSTALEGHHLSQVST